MAKANLRRQGDSIPFDRLLHQLVVPAFVLAPDGCVLVWNKACEQLTGIPASELIGTKEHWRAFYTEERPCLADLTLSGCLECIDKMYPTSCKVASIDEGLHAENWCEMPRRGERLYLSIDAGPIYDDTGRIVAVVETLRDWTTWKRTESQLKLTEAIFLNATEGMFVTDPAATILMVNPALTLLTGYSAEELIGNNPRMMQSGVQDSAFYKEMWRTLRETGQWSGELWDRRKSGEIFPVKIFISAIADESGTVANYIALFNDITAEKNVKEQLEDMATHDALTGLPNRIALSIRLHQALALAHQNNQLVAVCLIDLDGFKPVNDTYGHDVGDKVLIDIASRLRNVIRSSDTVARIGGDEFVMLLSEFSNMDEIELALTRIVDTLNKPVTVDDLRINLSASIGVTVHPFDDSDTDTLIRHADQAMYIAKNMGRNTWRMYDVNDDHNTNHIGSMLGQVRIALQAGQFQLYYQPKVNLRTGAIVGMEALIRWHHPERGVVPPGEFLPLVENSTLIVDVGEWVIREALRQIGCWRDAGMDMKVSVNIAARQFQHIDFVETLRSILAEFPGIPHRLLEIEVLESTALDDVEKVRAVVMACQAMGVSFALDDFGTGYSTLTYLKRLPAHILKIDQTFIRDMLEDKEDLALIEGVIGLASVFRMDVIAEGVETREQGIVLMRVGCDVVQGYYIAPPMPAAKVIDWCANFTPHPSWAQWAEAAWDRTHLPLVLAEYDHLKWVQRVIASLDDAEIKFTGNEIHDPHACRFGQWYDGDGRQQYGHLPEFADIDAIHVRIHAVAVTMMQLRAAGSFESARQHVNELLELKDAIVSRLGKMHGIFLDQHRLTVPLPD